MSTSTETSMSTRMSTCASHKYKHKYKYEHTYDTTTMVVWASCAMHVHLGGALHALEQVSDQ